MKHLKRALLSTVVVSLVLLVLPGNILAQSASVSAISPVDSGGSGSVSVSISAPEIGAFELHINVSLGGVLRFDDITAGSGPGDFIIVDNLTSSNSASISGFMSTTPIIGNMTVAEISFTVVGSPGSSTTLDINGTLYDPRGNAIPGVILSGTTVQILGQDSPNIIPVLGGIGGGLLLVMAILFIVRRRVSWFHF